MRSPVEAPPLVVRRAERGIDSARAHTILADASRRQAELGHVAWSADDFLALDEAADHRDLYLATIGADVAACLILQWSDLRFWGERPADAAYLHKLAVHRDFAGRAVGLRLIAWAEKRAASAGRLLLRLDCERDNEEINRYYRDAGFALRGEHREDDRAWNLYEKAVAATNEAEG
jgi:GNAT superfamily N-acetyltransferase